MPIASMDDGYTKQHWGLVRDEIISAVNSSGYKCEMVSETSVEPIIMKSIVTNIANNPIIVCDVSNNNPNVLFELGLRFALGKPTIIIKDENTKFIFDLGSYRQILYNKNLKPDTVKKLKDDIVKAILRIENATDVELIQHSFLKAFLKDESYIKVMQSDTTAIDNLARLVEGMSKEIKELKSRSMSRGQKLFYS